MKNILHKIWNNIQTTIKEDAKVWRTLSFKKKLDVIMLYIGGMGICSFIILCFLPNKICPYVFYLASPAYFYISFILDDD